MTVQELYDHILKNMTAEQALKKLLQGSLHEYQFLRFSAEGKEIHPAMLVVMAAQEMGWDVAIPDIKEDEEIQGMVIGTEEYMNNTLGMQKEEKCQCGDDCSNTCCKSE